MRPDGDLGLGQPGAELLPQGRHALEMAGLGFVFWMADHPADEMNGLTIHDPRMQVATAFRKLLIRTTWPNSRAYGRPHVLA